MSMFLRARNFEHRLNRHRRMYSMCEYISFVFCKISVKFCCRFSVTILDSTNLCNYLHIGWLDP